MRKSELAAILERIAAGEATPADLEALRGVIREKRPAGGSIRVSGNVSHSVLLSGDRVVHLGRYPVLSGQGNAIDIGGLEYRGRGKQAILKAIRALRREAAQAAPQTPARDPAAARLPARLPARLYDLLSGRAFTLDELEDVCFRLDIDWDGLRGETKAQKARSLVRACAAGGRVEELRQQIAALRPNAAARLDESA
jgi:hypothetical protein